MLCEILGATRFDAHASLSSCSVGSSSRTTGPMGACSPACRWRNTTRSPITMELTSVLKEMLPSPASSSSAPPRPAPAGQSGPLSEIAELAKIVEDLSKSVASLAKRKDSGNGSGAVIKRTSKDKGKGKGEGWNWGFRRENSSRFGSSTSTCVYCASDSSFISLQVELKSDSSVRKTLAATMRAHLRTSCGLSGCHHGFDQCSCVKPQWELALLVSKASTRPTLVKTSGCTQRFLHLQDAAPPRLICWSRCNHCFSSFILHSVDPVALITVFDVFEKDTRNNFLLHFFFHLFTLGPCTILSSAVTTLSFEPRTGRLSSWLGQSTLRGLPASSPRTSGTFPRRDIC